MEEQDKQWWDKKLGNSFIPYKINNKARNKKLWKWMKKNHPNLLNEFKENHKGYCL